MYVHTSLIRRFFAYSEFSNSALCFQPLQQAVYRKRCLKAGKQVPEALWWSALWATPFMPIGLAIASGFSGPQFPWMAPLVGRMCGIILSLAYIQGLFVQVGFALFGFG